jgi:hypothetical protein
MGHAQNFSSSGRKEQRCERVGRFFDTSSRDVYRSRKVGIGSGIKSGMGVDNVAGVERGRQGGDSRGIIAFFW